VGYIAAATATCFYLLQRLTGFLEHSYFHTQVVPEICGGKTTGGAGTYDSYFHCKYSAKVGCNSKHGIGSQPKNKQPCPG
jgi:hypothetical protein